MSRVLEKYLDRVMIYANRNEKDAAQIRAEQEDHLLQKISDIEADGLSHEDAVFQAIEEHGSARTIGYGLRRRFPLLDVRSCGTARGFIAIGPKAVGIIAFGGVAVGLFAFGVFAFGILAFGALALAGLISYGGVCVTPLGIALGLVVLGRVAIGVIAGGGLAVGLWVTLAVDHVSLLSTDYGPQFFLHYFAGPQERLAPIITTLWFFLMFPIMAGISQVIKMDEYRRMEKADPKLVE